MAALRDPAIKLFGRTIPLLDTPPPTGEADKVLSKLTNDVQNNDGIPYSPNEVVNVDARSRSPESSNKNDWMAIKNLKDEKTETDSKSEEVKTESVKTDSDGSGQEKLLKKPDKILPCPRCNSMETKFCYYNNYNVNQPRHFCKNCQRYWTAGGTMRNVPVGAGRRKNKHVSHFRHVMIPSDSIVAAHGDVSDLVCHQALPCGPPVPVGTVKGNETVLKFGSDVPLCESMATALDIGEQKNTDFASSASGDNKEEQSCASSVAVSNCLGNGMPDNTVKIEPSGMSGNSSGTALPHMHCYPAGPALMFPWSPGWNNVAALAAARCSTELVHASANGKSNPLSLAAPSMMASPGICAPAVPFPLVPPSFWSCMPGWPNVMWGAPWPGCNSTTSLSNPSSDSTCLGNISPTLGKHARETSLPGEEKTQKNLWVPKTLRIDDPDEAAKSSIWATLGIKPDEKGIFKSFQPKVLKTDETPGSPQVLQANPAAFSRSQSFQEGN